jgi:hypothetical protein
VKKYTIKIDASIYKQQTAILEESIDAISKTRKALLKENAHILENSDNIFIPILDETTGQKTYLTKNFDEYLEECKNDKTKPLLNRYDNVYNVLNESIEYEASLYFDTPEKILEEQGESPEQEEPKKSFVQRGKEAVKGAVEKGKEAFKKGKLFFFLKIVEQGLKLALTISKGVIPLIKRFVFKKIVLPLIKKYAQGKAKVTGIFAQLKEYGTTKLPELIRKITKPFYWISGKITGNAEKAAELAPLLMSITGLCLVLAVMYASGGLAMFNQTVNSTEKGIQISLEALPEEAAAGMCIAENIFISGKKHAVLLKEVCGLVDEAGKNVSNEVQAALMRSLVSDINTHGKDSAGTIVASWSKKIADLDTGGAFVEEGSELMTGSDPADMAGRVLSALKTTGLDGSEIDVQLNAFDDNTAAYITQKLAAAKTFVANNGSELGVSKEALDKLGDSIQYSIENHGSTTITEIAEGKRLTQIVTDTIKQTYRSAIIKEALLSESQINRFKVLANIEQKV